MIQAIVHTINGGMESLVTRNPSFFKNVNTVGVIRNEQADVIIRISPEIPTDTELSGYTIEDPPILCIITNNQQGIKATCATKNTEQAVRTVRYMQLTYPGDFDLLPLISLFQCCKKRSQLVTSVNQVKQVLANRKIDSIETLLFNLKKTNRATDLTGRLMALQASINALGISNPSEFL